MPTFKGDHPENRGIFPDTMYAMVHFINENKVHIFEADFESQDKLDFDILSDLPICKSEIDFNNGVEILGFCNAKTMAELYLKYKNKRCLFCENIINDLWNEILI